MVSSTPDSFITRTKEQFTMRYTLNKRKLGDNSSKINLKVGKSPTYQPPKIKLLLVLKK